MDKDKGAKGPGSGQRGKTPSDDFALHKHIGGKLKAMFDEVVEEPVPERLRKLLEELDRTPPNPPKK